MQIQESSKEFVLASGITKEKTKYVFFGVPEEKGSDELSLFPDSSRAPKAVRQASQSFCAYPRTENGKQMEFIANSFSPISENNFPLVDIGDKKNRRSRKNNRNNYCK